MFKVFAFGFGTRNKTISSLIYRLINEALLVADHQMPFQLMDIPHWFLINMFLRFGFSRYLQPLVHWCGLHAARDETKPQQNEWCIGLYYCDVLLLKHLLPDICQIAGDFTARYTLATKLNSTRSTLLNRQQIGNKVDRSTTFNFVADNYITVECIGKKVERSTSLNFRLCCRFVAGSSKSTVLYSTLLPVCTGLNFPVHHACTRAPSCCDTRLRTSHQTCGLPIEQTSIL